jgi:hypothetical protein
VSNFSSKAIECSSVDAQETHIIIRMWTSIYAIATVPFEGSIDKDLWTLKWRSKEENGNVLFHVFIAYVTLN